MSKGLRGSNTDAPRFYRYDRYQFNAKVQQGDDANVVYLGDKSDVPKARNERNSVANR